MKKLKILTSGIMALFLMILSTSSVFAGGGGVYADVTYTDDPHKFIKKIFPLFK